MPLQEFKSLEDAAFKVLEAVEATKAALAAKDVELTAIRAEFEQKKKEVSMALLCQPRLWRPRLWWH